LSAPAIGLFNGVDPVRSPKAIDDYANDTACSRSHQPIIQSHFNLSDAMLCAKRITLRVLTSTEISYDSVLSGGRTWTGTLWRARYASGHPPGRRYGARIQILPGIPAEALSGAHGVQYSFRGSSHSRRYLDDRVAIVFKLTRISGQECLVAQPDAIISAIRAVSAPSSRSSSKGHDFSKM